MAEGRFFLFWFVLCLTQLTYAQDAAQQNPQGPGPSQEASRPPPPIWLKCLNQTSSEEAAGDNIAGVFKAWCKNYNSIIDCLSDELNTTSSNNPLDFFINLSFDPDVMRSHSQNLCQQLEVYSAQIDCARTPNASVSAVCAGAFSQGLLFVYGANRDLNPPKEVLMNVACNVTGRTTHCLRNTLSDCDVQVQTTLLNYYSLFTNETCVSQPGDAIPVLRVPDTRPKPPPPPKTVVVKCAQEAAETVPRDENQPQPKSLVDFVVLGLRQDCKAYTARYECYERELENITNFMDFWLSLTFDKTNAINSQGDYCEHIDEHVIPYLTDACFNQSQPGLAACEKGFGREVETIRREWFNNTDFDGLSLQREACRTSVVRATCLGDAMRNCGDSVSRAMAISELGILPDICRKLLNPETSTSDPGSSVSGGHPGQATEHTTESRNQATGNAGDRENYDLGGVNNNRIPGENYPTSKETEEEKKQEKDANDVSATDRSSKENDDDDNNSAVARGENVFLVLTPFFLSTYFLQFV